MLTAAVQRPASVFTVRLAGQMIVGLMESLSVILKIQEVKFEASSVAVMVTGITVP
jgi:hypothetical protein